MNSVRKCKFIVGVLFALNFSVLTGCSTNVIPEDETENSAAQTEDLSSEIDALDSDTTVIGEVSHGIRQDEVEGLTEKGYLTYNGGELMIPYRTCVSGDATDIGFLVFLDGQPQAYHTDEDAEDAYFHVLEPKEDVEAEFDIIFTPTIGQTGDTLELTVLSVWHPDFIPDMVETSAYGMYHQALEANCKVKLEADPPTDAARSITNSVVMDITTKETDLTTEYLEGSISLNYGMSGITQESLDDNIYDVVLFDDTYITDRYAMNSDSVSITIEMCGKDGTEYYITPFIDHVPISGAQLVTVKKGKVSSLTVNLNVAELGDFQTFYFIAIPAGCENFYHIKTSSILLYREDGVATKSEAEGTTPENSDSSVSSNSSLFDSDQFSGGIEDVYYAGEDQLLVYADDFYLYVMGTKTIIGEYSVKEGRVSLRKFFRTADGYALVGQVQGDASASLSSGGVSMKCWLFDQSLSCIQIIDLGELAARENDPFALTAAVSGDGESIAIAGNNGLYRYDIGQDKLIKLFDYDETEYADYMSVSQLAFTGQDEKIVFEATTLDLATNVNTQIYGLVSVDGNEFVCYTPSDYALTDEIIVQTDEIWFPEAFDQATGKLLVTDTEGNRLRVVSFAGEDTGADGVYGSTNGDYIATTEWLDEQDSWRVRIYDADSGEMVHEKLCRLTRENCSTTFHRVRILDEQREGIVIAGQGQETQIFFFDF